MSWASINCAAEFWAKKAGLTAYWEDQHCGVMCEPYVEFVITSVEEIGRESVTHQYDETDGKLYPIICTRVQFLVSARIETTKHAPNCDAVALMNRLRMALQLESVAAEFKTQNVAHLSSSPIRRSNYERVDEMVSRATMDVVLSTTTSLRDCEIPWIETITVTSQESYGDDLVDADLLLNQETMP